MQFRFSPTVAALALVIASVASAADLPTGDLSSGRTCGTPEVSPEEQLNIQQQVDQFISQNGADLMVTGGNIKVAWHVIYSGSTGNIPQSQIDASVTELNKAYSGFYGGANTGYTFSWATTDRTSRSSWFKMTPGSGAESQAKNALAIDPLHRLNIYSCKPGQSLLGWATFPWSYAENSKLHGVVIHYGSVPGGYLSPYNLGGTADHEVGHYLGLYHTFQGGCTSPGDQVSDTPYEATPTSGCPSGKDTCTSTGVDPIHNYMDYSTDICYTEFTAGQDTRMDTQVTTYKPNLINAPIAPNEPQGDLTSNDPRGTFMPLGVEFEGASPNPFHGTTELHFSLPTEKQVDLRLYSAGGRLVQTLVADRMAAGDHNVTLDGRGLSAGIYFAALRVDGEVQNRTVVVSR